jgi:hypothetical protein
MPHGMTGVLPFKFAVRFVEQVPMDPLALLYDKNLNQ